MGYLKNDKLSLLGQFWELSYKTLQIIKDCQLLDLFIKSIVVYITLTELKCTTLDNLELHIMHSVKL